MGLGGTVIEATFPFSPAIKEASTDRELRDAFGALPDYVKTQPLEGERLSEIIFARKQAEDDLAKAEESIKAADLGTLSQRQQLKEFQAHMDGCAPAGSQAAEVAACADAYERVIVVPA